MRLVIWPDKISSPCACLPVSVKIKFFVFLFLNLICFALDDPYDEVAEAKMQAPEALGSKSLSGQDLQWLKRKQDVYQGANFKSFVSQLYDARDPGQAALLDKVYPALNAEREQIIDQRAELEKRLGKFLVVDDTYSKN